MPKLEEGTYLYAKNYAPDYQWWRVSHSSNEHGWYAQVYCLHADCRLTVERNEEKGIWKIQGVSAEPFTEFEYLLLRATDTQEQGTGT